MPSASRPSASGSESTPQAAARSTRADASDDRAAAGQQVGQAAGLDRAAIARPTRHPRQPGPGLRRQFGCRGEGAGRRREALAEQHDRGAVHAVLGLLEQRSGGPPPRRRERLGPNGRRACAARGWCTARARSPGCGRPGPPCAAGGRSRRPRPRARGRPGPPSRPTRGRRTLLRRCRVRSARPGSARNAASSAECGRARKSMSLVPSATRANLPYAKASSAVSRPPVSTPTPPAALAAARPRAATVNASGQDAGRSRPSSPRTCG